jgi:phage-related minor tail protein
MVDLNDPNTFVGPQPEAADSTSALLRAIEKADLQANSLEATTNRLSRSLSQAFVGATVGGKQFDDVLKTLTLRMSSLTVSAAFRPLATGLSSGLSSLFSGLFGGAPSAGVKAATGAIKPFAAGGVIGTPTYFPLSSGGLGLAGEAGPEAIVPLRRGADGRLGIAAGSGNAGASVTVNISTPDADSFRRSEVYLTGQIARAVARGQRGL